MRLLGLFMCSGRRHKRSRTEAGAGVDGRGDWIRTSDFFVPNEARYQAAPRPDRRAEYTNSDGYW